jgi:hypothetical protein
LQISHRKLWKVCLHQHWNCVTRHEATPIRKISIVVAGCRTTSRDKIFIVRVNRP